MTFEIDWEEQWRLHAPGFKNGFLPLRIKEHTLLMKPGPGFGDLSHPTTHLVLRLMKEPIFDKNVLDIGSGSGILSLVAKVLKAKTVFGIDIDEKAIQHAKENADLNKLEIHFGKASDYKEKTKPVVLINMIFSEQKEALKELPDLDPIEWIASGLLKSEKQAYIDFLALKGLKVVEEAKEGEWIGLRAIKSDFEK
jgi:ribosomal protein L11 methyltransferase